MYVCAQIDSRMFLGTPKLALVFGFQVVCTLEIKHIYKHWLRLGFLWGMRFKYLLEPFCFVWRRLPIRTVHFTHLSTSSASLPRMSACTCSWLWIKDSLILGGWDYQVETLFIVCIGIVLSAYFLYYFKLVDNQFFWWF